MDPTPIDSLRHRLQEFASAVGNARAHFSDPEYSGAFSAYVPSYEKARTLALLDTLVEEGAEIPSEMWQEYVRITRWLEAFGQESGPGYRKALLDELVTLTQAYQAALCYAYLGDPAVRQPKERSVIGVLLSELKKDHDISELELLITNLDEQAAGIAGIRHEARPSMDVTTLNITRDPIKRGDKGIP
nr:hypothetical protein [uncultured Methanoregula sp.]